MSDFFKREIYTIIVKQPLEVTEQMDKYDLQRAIDPIIRFLDLLNNWYIRRSRRRFWKSENDLDKDQARERSIQPSKTSPRKRRNSSSVAGLSRKRDATLTLADSSRYPS